ncbi:MAG: hypothetical protein M1832_003253 [Thelocarpon impressellum]|nr:MAG: hypothetical protein M1832_003253 [Thelocarpon impressellum]
MSDSEETSTTFKDATAVTPVASHLYSASFPDDWCIGSVPHGGYMTSMFMQVASAHFGGTLTRQKQPHTITLHLEFLRRTQVGPALFTVKDVKLGRQMSTIHVSLSQAEREEVAGYITNSNIATEAGLSLETDWALQPGPPPVDLVRLRQDGDPRWAAQEEMPFASFRKAATKVDVFLPRSGQQHRSLADEWIRFANGERFTNESLGYVADSWPQVVESFRPADGPDILEGLQPEAGAKNKGWATHWYPTLLLNLDVKKSLPADGVEWLFVRVRAKSIKNGRFDLEVVILDDTDDVVALSHHVCLIVSAARNIAARSGPADKERVKL